MSNLIKAAAGDAILTSLFVFVGPIMRLLTAILASFFGFQARSLIGRFITTIHATVQVLIFSMIGKLLGGASFNPCTTLTFYAAGFNPGTSLISMAVQFPAQAVGGAGGAKAILQLMPAKYEQFVRGPSLKVDVKSGAIAEGLFTFSLCFSLLFVMLKGPRSLILQIWLVKVATVGLAVLGSGFTGPSMNPANAFGWAYVNNWHNTWELFYVYWIGPLVGAVLAARVFKILFPPPEAKEKKA
ncbi:aquaporin SIP1-1-like [Argentina anserina]|uniref:aquaporin SIP1-1-like n=1 Tax=Argentina anserina TaxID=57926 RepID=UPI0021766937|nr:aquaporin SIP1-1-like [Potentilla anserina]